jgi:uncharacterized OsmC-like protein
MSQPIELSKITIIQDERPNRRAYIANFKEPFHYGVHGGVKDFYKVEPKVEYPSTLDHIVASAGGWLTGTLSGALEARQIPTFPDKLKANVEGFIEAPEGVLKITRIRCHFEVKVPQGKKEAAERALNTFERGCPVAQTLKGCVEFEYHWDIEEYE